MDYINDWRNKNIKDYTLIDKFFCMCDMFLWGFDTFQYYIFKFMHGGSWAKDTRDPENPICIWSPEGDYGTDEERWWELYDFMINL